LPYFEKRTKLPLIGEHFGASNSVTTRQVLSDLNSKGVLSGDIFPEELTAPLVNSYLKIKARHLW
jgi:hypothetical protein